jgi:hypothetical protein
MKTEVYGWRVSTELKSGLEREAQRRKTSVAAVLDLAARDWLQNSGGGRQGDGEQRRLQEDVLKCIGAFASGQQRQSESVRQIARERIRRRHGS